MVPARLFALIYGTASAMRPNAAETSHAALRSKFDGILAKMFEGGADSLIALHEAEQISGELASHLHNATNHLSDGDMALIREVIDVIRGSMYSSMTSSHDEEQKELDDALARIDKCNDDMVAAIADTGSVGKLLTKAEDQQSAYDKLETEKDALTASRDKALDALTQHMSRTQPAPVSSCTSLPKQEIPHWDVYFDSNDFVEWFVQEQQAYQGVRDEHKQAEKDLTGKTEELAQAETALRAEYCAFTLLLSTTCSSHDECFEAETKVLSETVARLEKTSEARKAAYEAGEMAIAHLKFLIGEAAAPDATTKVDSSQYQFNFPQVPAKLACEVNQPVWEDFLAASCQTWTLVARQTVPTWFKKNQWSLNPDDPSAANFAILDKLETFRDSDGGFEFKLVWPGSSIPDQVWRQTSNPVTKTGGGVDGYAAISAPNSANRWGGLEYGGRYSLLDGTVNHGNWFYAVGSFQQWSSGMPGPSQAVQVVELYVMREG